MSHPASLPRFGAVLGLALAAACSSTADLAAPRTSSLTPDSARLSAITAASSVLSWSKAVDTVGVGQAVTETLTGSVVASGAKIVYAITDSNYARVDTKGNVTGKKIGVTILVATAQIAGYPQASMKINVAASGSTSGGGTPSTAPTGPAALPSVFLTTSYVAPTGTTINVAAGASLQAAIDAALPGDEIVLAPGAKWVGNFRLRNKAGMTSSQWITIRSGGNIPVEGTRVQPGDSSQLAEISTANSAPAIQTDPGAQGWRLVGLQLDGAPGLTMTYFLVGLGDGSSAQTSLAQVPSRLIVDRSYVHGNPTLDIRRCIALNSASTAVIDSYISECHSNNGDSQAIYGWNGPGPFKLTNNYFEAGHEIVAFGGPAPAVTGIVPSDIEVRHNHFRRPMAWKGVWLAKNLWECKSCQRVLIEGNVMENNWVDAQNGYAILLQGLSDDNGAPQNRIWDVTIRNNIIRNTPSGFNLASRLCYNTSATACPLPVNPGYRISVTNNVVALNASLSGPGKALQLLSDLHDVTVSQNTFADMNDARQSSNVIMDMVPGTGVEQNLNILSNLFGAASYPFIGNATATALQSLAKFAPNTVMTGNFWVGASATGWPASNWSPTTFAAAGIPNLLAGDFTVLVPSTLQTSLGTFPPPGADWASVQLSTSGVVQE